MNWAVFPSGNRAPFDLDEQVTREDEVRWVLESATLDLQPPPPPQARRADVGELGVMAHHATCPARDQFRKSSPL